MFDADAAADTLASADFAPAQADAIVEVVRQVAAPGDYVTSDQFKADAAELRAETAQLDKRVSTQLAEHDARQSKQTAASRAEIAELRGEMRERFAEVKERFAELDARQTKQIDEVHVALANLEKRLSQQNAALRESLIRWVLGTLVGVGGLILGILRLLGLIGS